VIIIIDGYNVLKQKSREKFISESERNQFVRKLSAYKRKKQHAIIAVFDGGESSWPTWTEKNDIKIVYSGSALTADDVIHEYIVENKHKELLLVSSDRQLCLWASKHGIPAIDSSIFFDILQEALRGLKKLKRQKDSLVKMTEAEDAHLDMLMQESSAMIPEKDDSQALSESSYRWKDQRCSKIDRILRKKIDKL